jgi:hypothetical protein
VKSILEPQPPNVPCTRRSSSNLCDADPVGGPAKCRRFEVERKTDEKNLVLDEDMDLSGARTVAAANQSYKRTTALANARRMLPDGAVAVIVPEFSMESIGYAAMFDFILNQAYSMPHVWEWSLTTF